MNFKKTLLTGAVLVLATISSVYAAGPAGFGAIKLGMSKVEIVALSSKDKYYLSTPFTAVKTIGKSSTESETKYFDTTISGPYILGSVHTILGFNNDKLTSMHLMFTEHSWLYGYLKNLATEKYGAPKYVGVIDDQQCTLSNGKKYVVGTGIQSELWRENVVGTPSKIIQTSFDNTDFTGCGDAPIEHRFRLKTLSMGISIIDRPKSPLSNIKLEIEDAL